MPINAKQFIEHIAVPTLQRLAVDTPIRFSDVALNLCMGTIAQESQLGTYLVQENGPALGIGQIEPASLSNLLGKLSIAERAFLATIAVPTPPARNVVENLPYAFCLVRLFYWHIPEPLPSNTVSELFRYYKKHYNTDLGRATLMEWRLNWALASILLPD